MIRQFAASVEKLIVIEELDPFIEEAVRLMGIPVEGKSIFPLTGELDPRVVRESAINAGLLPASAHVPLPEVEVGPLPARPPVLCPGCPHRGVFYVLNKLKVPVNGDIGCYTLGLIPPLSAIHTCGCMGAGIAVAHGAVKAGSPEHHVAVIGDSTFFHTGIPALINTVYNRSRVITIIMDNRVTGMTGHQQNPGTGFTLQGEVTTQIELEPLVRASGNPARQNCAGVPRGGNRIHPKRVPETGRAGGAHHPRAMRASARGAQDLDAARSAGRAVQRLRLVLPHWLPGDPEER